MNEITDNILVNLKIISKIGPNNKLKLVNNYSTIEKEGIATWLTRWYYGDSREKTVNFIKTVVNDAINITNDLMNSTYINNKNKKTAYEETEFTKALSTLFLIKNEMSNSKTGIINLQKTYELDIQIISQLEVLLNKIDGHLGIIERKLKEIKDDYGISEKHMYKSDEMVKERDSRESREVREVREIKEGKDIREGKEERSNKRN
jgi:hypothetical protein